LGVGVVAVVEGGPSGEAGELGGGGEELASDGVGVGAVQQRGSALFEADGELGGAPVTAAVAGVPLAGLFGGFEQFGDVGVGDSAERGAGG
jgi:hypothetical protein